MDMFQNVIIHVDGTRNCPIDATVGAPELGNARPNITIYPDHELAPIDDRLLGPYSLCLG